MIYAIDPGVKACGVAEFDQMGELRWARYEDPMAGDYLAYSKLIIEMPRIYPGSGQQKGDLNDLLNLAAIVGRCEGRQVCPDVKRVSPAQWKGQVPKKIMTARILSKLTPIELSRIVRVGAKDHNTIDAIGIGLHYFERLK